MLRKINLRLTLLCTGVTGLLLLIMTCTYLYVAEKSLTESRYSAFEDDASTIISNLEAQSIISHAWLARLEAGNHALLFISDNGKPLIYGFLDKNESRAQLYAQISAYVDSEYEAAVSTSYSSYRQDFPWKSDSEDYFCTYTYMEKSGGSLEAYILYPLSQLKAQLIRQRLIFLFINLLALCALFLFFYYFTRRLMFPIEENQKKQTAFIASASHELRTPLTVMLSSISALEHCDEEKRSGFLRILQAEGARMNHLIQDMLLLASSDSKRFSIEKKPVDLDTILLNSVEAFEEMAAAKKLQLSLLLPEERWPKYICDAVRIGQVFDILLHNAVSYTPSGGNICVNAESRKQQFIVSVYNSGPGISDADKAHIFERFYRSDNARSAKGHYGLGLSIAYEIIKAHKGTIQVSDGIKGGAVFTVTLPLQNEVDTGNGKG